MAQEFISDDEEVTPDHYIEEGDIETRGIRTHFWKERTYIDRNGVEKWQDAQLINSKLWQITRFCNLKEKQREFPHVTAIVDTHSR